MRERRLSQVQIDIMRIEEEKPRIVRRKRPTEPKLPVIVETPEEIAAREAKLFAERALLNAILLIQSHERARIARYKGAAGDYLLVIANIENSITRDERQISEYMKMLERENFRD